MNFNVERAKREAKKMRKESGKTHSECLAEIARRQGFNNWSLLMKAQNKESKNA